MSSQPTFSTIFAETAHRASVIFEEIKRPDRSEMPFARYIVDRGDISAFAPLGETVHPARTRTLRLVVPTGKADLIASELAYVPGVLRVRPPFPGAHPG